ncbi:hypothetical protein J2755_000009 [Methanohalophilus levihalophilus]|uniref:hypothetical protein n=1 Tax=Methanohalophilus levihalophilus TaxID=1431282 RepID=UPI001AEAF11D|nr:hypothetical protein [Methanohalophilus levihalophilus]MBP2029089.1 hypothetical protein [Methanohalophilus levihalophilus]
MDLSNSRTMVLLILLCLAAALLGAASSYVFLGFEEPGYPPESSEELHISTNLLNNNVSLVLEELENKYPDDVSIGTDEVVIRGFDAITAFDSSYFENELEFNWDLLESQDGYITYIIDVDGIRYSQNISDYYRMSLAVGELYISRNLVNDEINMTLSEINETYPGSVYISDGEVVITGSEAHVEFDTSYFVNEISFDWDFNSSEKQQVMFVVKDDDYILHSSDVSGLYMKGFKDPFLAGYGMGFVTIDEPDHIFVTYEELENLLNGDNETVQHFQGILDMHHEMQSDKIHNHD